MSFEPASEEKFSPTLFFVTITLTFGGVIGLMSVVVPDQIWYVQWESAGWKYLVAFLSIQLAGSFVEWAFHRYVLHRYVLPGFKRLQVQHHHRHHATHTPIVDRDHQWQSRYPIVHKSQYEASFFPWFSYLGFLIFAAPFAIAAQMVWQNFPILVCVLISVGWSLTVYELLHAMEHLPMSFWDRVFRFTGKFGRKAYSFHQAHHVSRWMMHHNMAISGFVCGIPIPDLVLGTFRLPKGILDDGTPVVGVDIEPRRPWLVVRVLDYGADLVVSLRKAALGG